MPLITQGKTNLRYILIVVILAAIAGGGILSYYYLWIADLESRLVELELRLPEKIEDETANWKVYRNEKYGFEVKYPPTWIISGETIITLKSYQNSGSFLSIAPLGTQLPESIFDEENTGIQQTTFAGRRARELPQTLTDIGGGAKSINRVIRVEDIQDISWGQENEIRYQIWYTELELAETFNQILSTFRFLE